MNKKYIKNFFKLTEQNLLGHQLAANEIFDDNIEYVSPSSTKRTKWQHALTPIQYVSLSMVMLFWGAFLFLLIKPQNTETSRTSIRPVISHHIEEIQQKPQRLTSVIPSYRDGSKRQYMQPISLRRTDRLFIDPEVEDNRYAEIEPTVDKVIVTPKSFG